MINFKKLSEESIGFNTRLLERDDPMDQMQFLVGVHSSSFLNHRDPLVAFQEGQDTVIVVAKGVLLVVVAGLRTAIGWGHVLVHSAVEDKVDLSLAAY